MIKLISYNSTGLSPLTVEFIKDMLNTEKPDILLIQETFTLQSTQHKVADIHSDYLAFAVSGVDECSEYLHGRPSGGLAVLWKKTIDMSIQRIKPMSCHRRVCAIRMTAGESEILICNAYLPNDNYSADNVNNDFSIMCDQIEELIDSQSTKYVILGGDLNVDFRRNNAHSNWIYNMAVRQGLIDTWTLPESKPADTYIAYNHSARSRIDHFMCSNNLAHCVQGLDVLELSNNLSNHRPIRLQLNIDMTCGVSDASVTIDKGKCVSWHRARDNHIEQYKQILDNMLKNDAFPPAAYCKDLKCNDPQHKVELDLWCSRLTDACLNAGELCLPKCKRKSYARPGWSEHVSSYKKESMMWHQFWISCGEPSNGPIYESMKAAKRLYTYAARKVIKQEKQMKFEKMAQKSVLDNKRNFWDEVKRMKNSRQCSAPNINGCTKEEDIAEMFKSKYEELYTSVPSSDLEMEKVHDYIEREIANTNLVDHLICESEVSKAIESLKSGKSDGHKGLISDHLKHAPKRMCVIIALLLNAITRHGHMPNELLLSTLTSIPKDVRGNICCIENYRGIALSSCLSKVHDVIILNKYSDYLSTSDMQYAYKSKHGTTMCTLILKEVASYFKRNKGETYIAMIDASKAFDRVRHDRLFGVLMERKVHAIIMDSYKRQQLRTKWNNSFSDIFMTLNGIKQGSITSPVLFTVYMDYLLLKLEKSGYGCKIGGHYYGTLSYADDLTLISPTLSGLQCMLDLCEQFGKWFGVKYNPTKSVVMAVSRKAGHLPDLQLAGLPLKWVPVVKHLGNYVSSDLKETCEISHKRGDLIGRVNSMCATFAKADNKVKREIFNTQCSHFYGSEAWNMAMPEFHVFRKTWNHGIRKVFGLP